MEGLLNQIRDKLIESNPFAVAAADSADPERREAFRLFISRLEAAIGGTMPFTMTITDPMANSFVFSPYHPEPDPRLEVRDCCDLCRFML